MKQHLFLLLSFLSILSVAYCFNQTLLAEKIAKAPPEWMMEQIEKDLRAFKERGIYETDLENTMQHFSHNHLALRCKIINNKIHYYNRDKTLPLLVGEPSHNYHRLKAIHFVLKFFVKYYSLPDLDFIISLEDGLTDNTPAPIFTFAKNKHCHSLVAFPDFESIRGYQHLIKEVLKASEVYPFDHKINKAFWRGSTTGGNYTLSTWKHYPRSELVLFSKEHSDLLDAKFTNIVSDIDKAPLTTLFQQEHLLSANVSTPDHIPFKYLVDIDGNSCTYSRLFWILLSNSLCLKQISDNEQWYYNAIKPYVHYVPFKSMSNFTQAMQWAQTHEKEVKNIIHNSTEFVLHHLMQEDVFHYIYRALLDYAKLQKFQPRLSL